MKPKMPHDNILTEIRRFREDYAKRFNYDVRAMGRALQEKQKEYGDRLVSFPPKKIKRVKK